MPRSTEYAADLADISAAAARIEGAAHRTPVLTCDALDELAGRKLFFKCENFQKMGAFKFRGALNAVSLLSDEQAANGVVTHSSGNFAQALALAARAREIPAYIVMPSNAPSVKIRAVEGYGGKITLCEPTLEARNREAERIRSSTGSTLLHPYDDPRVIAGQGTVALEFLDQVDDLQAIVVPLGGGGLLSGITLAARELTPNVTVYGAEPSGADDAWRSRQAGRLIPQTGPDTIADGLLTSLGEWTWPVIRDLVHDVFLVDDDAICDAMRLIWERMKIIVEPSAATALAVVLSERFRVDCSAERVGLIISGGNVDLTNLPWSQDGR